MKVKENDMWRLTKGKRVQGSQTDGQINFGEGNVIRERGRFWEGNVWKRSGKWEALGKGT